MNLDSWIVGFFLCTVKFFNIFSLLFSKWTKFKFKEIKSFINWLMIKLSKPVKLWKWINYLKYFLTYSILIKHFLRFFNLNIAMHLKRTEFILDYFGRTALSIPKTKWFSIIYIKCLFVYCEMNFSSGLNFIFFKLYFLAKFYISFIKILNSISVPSTRHFL